MEGKLTLSTNQNIISYNNIPKNITLEQWINYCLKNIMSQRLEQTTLYGYKGIIRRYINPFLGSLKLKDIKPFVVQMYYTKLIDEIGLSPNTVIKHHDLLKVLFKYAYFNELVDDNPIHRVIPPKKIKPNMTVYNVDQLVELFRLSANTNLEIVIVLCVYLGLRRSEACGLCWSDIDFDNRTIFIHTARTSAGSDIIVKGTKTISSTRYLHMVDTLYHFLLKEKYMQECNKAALGKKYIDTDYVLVMKNGKPYRPNYISELFTDFIKDNNMPKIVLQELRHTFASLSNVAKVPEFDISKALGHSSPVTTKKIYTHLFDTKQVSTLQAVADIIENNR